MPNDDAMYRAVLRGDTAAARALLATDPSLLKAYVVKKSWLHWAAQRGNIGIMDLMVKAGLPVDCLTTDGSSTPLNIAAGQGRYDAAEWLVEHGADINRGLGAAATPLFSAIYSKSLKLVELLAENGANLDATFGDPRIDVIGYSEVHGTPEITEFLRERRTRHC